MVGAAGRKNIDSSGHSPVDRLSWIVSSENRLENIPRTRAGTAANFLRPYETIPLDPDIIHGIRILVAIILNLRYPADLVGVPSGVCVSATCHHYLGRNNSKGEHRRVRVPPNHPSNQVSCNVSKSCCGGLNTRNPSLKSVTKRDTEHTI